MTPAATLLLPYFEVNLDNPNGLTTLFSINNAAAAAVLAHVSIWSDLSVPLLNFDVYLTGYDVQTINLRDVIVNGGLPQTASTGQDPNGTISPKGPLSHSANFPSCAGRLPPPPLSPAITSHLQQALTGKPSPILGGLCAGQLLGDNVARGYITVDTVGDCTSSFPGDPGYFAANNGGDVTDQNVLWGAWYIIDTSRGYAQASDMVPIAADGTDPATSTPGRYTFYGRFDGWTAVDHREPLATRFAAQYALGGAFNGGTDVLIWRDPKTAQGPFACPSRFGVPGWYPLDMEGLAWFDEQEHVVLPFVCTDPVECPPGSSLDFFPAAAQRVAAGSAQLPTPFNFGWLDLDLNWSNGVPPGSDPAIDPRAQQAWVGWALSSNRHFAVAFEGLRLDSACAANHTHP